jgi:hypothetical protein
VIIFESEYIIHSRGIEMHVHIFVENSKLHQDSDSINGPEPEWTVQMWMQYY